MQLRSRALAAALAALWLGAPPALAATDEVKLEKKVGRYALPEGTSVFEKQRVLCVCEPGDLQIPAGAVGVLVQAHPMTELSRFVALRCVVPSYTFEGDAYGSAPCDEWKLLVR